MKLTTASPSSSTSPFSPTFSPSWLPISPTLPVTAVWHPSLFDGPAEERRDQAKGPLHQRQNKGAGIFKRHSPTGCHSSCCWLYTANFKGPSNQLHKQLLLHPSCAGKGSSALDSDTDLSSWSSKLVRERTQFSASQPLPFRGGGAGSRD